MRPFATFGASRAGSRRATGRRRRANSVAQQNPPATSGHEATVQEPEQPTGSGDRSVRELGRRVLEVESNSVLIATVALILFIGILHPAVLAWGQLKGVVQNAAYVGI